MTPRDLVILLGAFLVLLSLLGWAAERWVAR